MQSLAKWHFVKKSVARRTCTISQANKLRTYVTNLNEWFSCNHAIPIASHIPIPISEVAISSEEVGEGVVIVVMVVFDGPVI